MSRLSTYARAAAVAAFVLLAPASAARAQTAVIVHPSAPLADASVETLRRYFLGKSATLGSSRVEVVEYVKARNAFYRSLLGLSEDEVRRRWVALAFRGEVQSVPLELTDPVAVRRYVAAHPGVIGFVDVATVDPSVKVLTVGGHRPGDAGYPLH